MLGEFTLRLDSTTAIALSPIVSKTMQLSEADKKKVLDWMSEKCGLMRCTACGHSQWTLVDVATMPIGVDLHSTRFYYSQGIPQITIACGNCGHMLFFNPAIMGFKPDEPPPVDVKSEK